MEDVDVWAASDIATLAGVTSETRPVDFDRGSTVTYEV